MKRILLLITILASAGIMLLGNDPAQAFRGGGGRGGSQATTAIEPKGAILWEQLKKMDYKAKFKMWPGKTSLYQGTEPHGSLLTTYVNIPALMNIVGKKGVLPEGSIVIKENYSADKKLMSVTVMYKVRAYNPDAGDWFWAKYAPDGKVEAEGKVDACIKCHSAKKDNDYIQTGSLK